MARSTSPNKAAGVQQTHPLYNRYRFTWRMIRDAVEGEQAIKRADTVYLPMPSAMLENAGNSSSLTFQGGYRNYDLDDKPDNQDDYWREYDPNYHWNSPYAAYKKRAHFPGITGNIFRGLKGVATNKESVIKLPESLSYLEDNATRTGRGLCQLYDQVLDNTLQVGRGFILADVDPRTDTIYGSFYNAESIINWRENVVDGVSVVEYVVLVEYVTPDSNDEFDNQKVARYRVPRLRNGVYQVDIHEEGKPVRTVTPQFRGKTLDYIPGVVVGSTNNDLEPDLPPMEGIARCAVQIYMKSADLGQAEFMSCNPTLFVSGVDSNAAPTVVGSTVIAVLENPDAKAFYPKTDTSALQYVGARQVEFMNEAYEYGMALLGGGKKMAESAEALRIRQATSGATLFTIVGSVGAGIKRFLQVVAEWSGEDPEAVDFEPNRSFSDTVLTAAEMQALLQAWMAGGISWPTYTQNMRKAGLIPADVDDDEEEKRLKTNPPAVKAVGEGEPTGPGNSSQPSRNPTKTLGSDNPQDSQN